MLKLKISKLTVQVFVLCVNILTTKTQCECHKKVVAWSLTHQRGNCVSVTICLTSI